MVRRSHLSIGEVLVAAPRRVPGCDDLENPFPRKPGAGRPGADAVGLPEVLRLGYRAAALGFTPAEGRFLPLKVIKGRLDNQPDPADEETEDELGGGREVELRRRELEGRGAGPARSGRALQPRLYRGH